MKWKDSEEMVNTEGEKPHEEYFDEEQFSPWSNQQHQSKKFRLGKVPLLIFLLIICIIAALAALLMLLFGGNGAGADQKRVAMMEERVRQLEERLNKYEAIDEKVTRIWEQAKSFERFQDRFNRSEASTSLRMDHLTMSLEALQKQVKDIRTPPVVAKPEKETQQGTPAAQMQVQYHQVVAGDTLFSISRRYNMSVDELLAVNRMDKNSVIVPGQKLIVSGGARN